MLERYSGVSREEMLDFARLYAQSRSAVFVWSMGITQHRFGVDNVKAIVNLALARGMLGRERCGLMPIRGHSGVQGGAEMGAVPWHLPSGDPVNDQNVKRLEELWGFSIPTSRGLSAVEMIERAHQGEIDILYSLGGNFLETLPEPKFVCEALESVPLRVHQDIVLTSQMFLEPADTVLLLPAQTRYEQQGGGTETSTGRRIYFSPEIPGRRIGEARPEWEILMELAERVHPQRANLIHYDTSQRIREEIAVAIPAYQGIEKLAQKGDAIQWGGSRLCEGGHFETLDGRARFTPLSPPETDIPQGWYLLSTRRRKQFNSMVQGRRDPLTGAMRDSALMNREDDHHLDLKEDSPLLLRPPVGEFKGRCKLSPIKEHNVQVHWPEGTVLIERGAVDPLCGIPDYNTLVQVIPLNGEAKGQRQSSTNSIELAGECREPRTVSKFF